MPTEVTPAEVAREKTLGAAIALCARAAGYEPKEMTDALKMDKAQWSRWESGQEGVIWPKLTAVMDHCGNDAPLLWMLQARGYDLTSLRKRETLLEQKLRQAEERIKELEHARQIERALFRDLRVSA
ncbi:hypothetical protein [Xenophilus sp. Marseille-Q4582]|uniref:hypothetical protein n=1 Tax=Xenophilus sp. Marseille-Q4582 TaxID=2866600 RepID=UPI001CE4AAE8|nr:hypothetical protein [Xenophilus sp. Marseille-Q4582]